MGGTMASSLLRGRDGKAYRGQLRQEHRLWQPVKYMRQTLQVVWLHICKKWKSLGENWAQTERGNSIPISGEAGTSAYRDFYFFFFTKKKKKKKETNLKRISFKSREMHNYKVFGRAE